MQRAQTCAPFALCLNCEQMEKGRAVKIAFRVSEGVCGQETHAKEVLSSHVGLWQGSATPGEPSSAAGRRGDPEIDVSGSSDGRWRQSYMNLGLQ